MALTQRGVVIISSTLILQNVLKCLLCFEKFKVFAVSESKKFPLSVFFSETFSGKGIPQQLSFTSTDGNSDD